MAITRDDHLPSTITKTRIAPTPSGYLHLGNAFSFALTAALAEKYNARIVLRIDDLDQERVRPAYVQDIFDTLDFLEIGWHEGPRNPREVEREYSQIHRLDLYRRAFDTLISQSAIFACNCSRARVQEAAPDSVYKCRCIEKALPLDTPEVRWRLRTSTDLALTVRTLDGTINTFLPPEQQNFIVRKKDGMPAYQLASLIDDQYFGVDFIVRGTDLWPSTLAQHYLAKGLSVQSFLDTTFHHHALFTAVDGTKLSKSAGATSIQYLRKAGKTRADVYNLIARHAGIKENVSGWKELFAAAQLSTNHG
jgi:glutamyl-tRNA synthetase